MSEGKKTAGCRKANTRNPVVKSGMEPRTSNYIPTGPNVAARTSTLSSARNLAWPEVPRDQLLQSLAFLVLSTREVTKSQVKCAWVRLPDECGGHVMNGGPSGIMLEINGDGIISAAAVGSALESGIEASKHSRQASRW